jgi:hypothetical protein
MRQETDSNFQPFEPAESKPDSSDIGSLDALALLEQGRQSRNFSDRFSGSVPGVSAANDNRNLEMRGILPPLELQGISDERLVASVRDVRGERELDKFLADLSPQARKQAEGILNDPNYSAAKTELVKLLNAPEGSKQDRREVAGNLVRLLGSSDERESGDGTKLLSMLADPKQRDASLNILKLANPFSGNNDMHNVLMLCTSPEHKNSAEAVLGLIRGGSVAECSAGAALAAMLQSHDKSARSDGHALAKMLGSSDERESAIAMLCQLGNQTEIHTLLKLSSNPAFAKATERLKEMLQSEAGSSQASQLLRALSSRYPEERADGSKLLDLLNDKNPEQAKLCQSIMKSAPEMDVRHDLLSLLEKPETRQGVKSVLNQVDSPSRREQSLGRELLRMLGSTRSDEKNDAVHLIGMLGRGDQGRRMAQTIVSQVEDRIDRHAIVQLVKSNEPRDHAAGKQLVSLLEGNTEERSAARLMLGGLAGIVGERANDPSKRSKLLAPNDSGSKDSLEQLTDMLVDPKKVSDLVKLMDKLSMPQLETLMELKGDKATSQNAESIQRMIISGPESERNAAIALVDALDQRRILNTPDRSLSGKQDLLLLSMLGGNGEDKKFAEQALRLLPNGAERDRLLELRLSDKSLSNQILTKLNGGERTDLVRSILVGSRDSNTAKQLLELLTDPKNREAWSNLKLASPSPEASRTLMSMLVSPNKEVHETGRQLLDMLKDQGTMWAAGELLSSNLQPDQVKCVKELIDGKQTRDAGKSVLELLQGEDTAVLGQKLVGLLSSKDDTNRADGRDLAAMLANGGLDRSRALRLLTSTSILPNLTTSEGQTEQQESETRHRLLSMFKNPETKQLARKITDSLPAISEMRQFLKHADPDARQPEHIKEAGKQLMSLMMSNSLQDNQAASTLVILLSSDRESSKMDGERILHMLGNPKQRNDARLLLERQPGETVRFTSPYLISPMLDPQKNALTREALSTFDGLEADGLVKVGLLLREEKYHSTLKSLIDMYSDPRNREDARAILQAGLDVNDMQTIVDLLHDPRKQSGANELVKVLKSDSADARRPAEFLISHLASKDPQEVKAGEQLFKMLSSEQRRSEAFDLALCLPEQDQLRLLQMLESPKTRKAGELLRDMLRTTFNDTRGSREQRQTANKLFDMLSSPETAIRKQGEQMLSMLNDPNYQNTALKRLRRLARP